MDLVRLPSLRAHQTALRTPPALATGAGQRTPVRALRGGWVIVDASAPTDVAAADPASQPLTTGIANDVGVHVGVGQPVFAGQNGYLAPLPELTITDERPTMLDEAEVWLNQHAVGEAQVNRAGDRIIARVISGQGESAMALANALYEALKPRSCEATFIRVAHPLGKLSDVRRSSREE